MPNKPWDELGTKAKKSYLNAFGQLYSRNQENLVLPPRVESKKPPKASNAVKAPKERKEQITTVAWLKKQQYNGRPILFHADMAAGKRSLALGAFLKLMGLSAGYPDLTIHEPNGRYHGLYIELKRVSGGVVSEHQRWWLTELNARGYYACVAKGHEEAIRICREYFGWTP